ncbi:MAG: aminotransferase class III-fold pyridoxal phosphate-dependent enzyme, partial [Planctomycetes bacterium]|nr:aminotransferase class III-fold pyridoxal phosphate-dependent enzyme [Planctomycetota bacterium]
PEEVAAILVEPVQGEGGYLPAPKRLLEGLRKRCDEHGILLIFDEVQSGFGRTCRWFASEHAGVVPDVMAVAKGIASGFPLSAVCAPKKLMKQWTTSAHGTTFGGNPVSCAAAVATIDTIEQDRLLEKSAAVSVQVFRRLHEMQKKYPAIGDVRGLGFMIGIELVGDKKAPDADLTKRTLAGCKERGLVLIPCGINGNTIRFIPPLICTRKEMDRALDILDAALKGAGAAR